MAERKIAYQITCTAGPSAASPGVGSGSSASTYWILPIQRSADASDERVSIFSLTSVSSESDDARFSAETLQRSALFGRSSTTSPGLRDSALECQRRSRGRDRNAPVLDAIDTDSSIQLVARGVASRSDWGSDELGFVVVRRIAVVGDNLMTLRQ